MTTGELDANAGYRGSTYFFVIAANREVGFHALIFTPIEPSSPIITAPHHIFLT